MDREERNAEMVLAFSKGATKSEIARKFRLSLSWTGQLLRQNGAEVPATGRGIKVDLDVEEVVEEYVHGATVRALATAHDVSYGKIYRLLKAAEVEMRPTGFPAR